MGGKSSTSTSTVKIPPEVLARYNAVNARAENAAATPYQAFGKTASDYVAQMNAQQNAGIADINATAGSYLPYMDQATTATQAGMGPAYEGIDNYMSPYIKNVADTTGAYMRQQQEQAQSGALGNAVSSGAFGGDRAGIAAANLQQQNQMGYGKTMADIYNQGYTQALGASQADLARQLAGGAQLAGLGAQSQQLGLQGAQAKIAAGTMQQQTEQAGKDAMINQFMQEKGYPFQIAQFLANIAMGTGAASGSTTSTTTPRNWLGFASGGVAGPRTYTQSGVGGEGYVPAGDLPVGQLMIADPPEQKEGNGMEDILKLIEAVGGGAKNGGAIDQRHGYATDGSVEDLRLRLDDALIEQLLGDKATKPVVSDGKDSKLGTERGILGTNPQYSGSKVLSPMTTEQLRNRVNDPDYYDFVGFQTRRNLSDARSQAETNPANMGYGAGQNMGNQSRVYPYPPSPTTGVAAASDAAPTTSPRPPARPEGLGAADVTAPTTSPRPMPRPTGLGAANVTPAVTAPAPPAAEVPVATPAGGVGSADIAADAMKTLNVTDVTPNAFDIPKAPAVTLGSEAKPAAVDPIDFFNTKIIRQESGDNQFDSKGNPLTSSAGAVGVAQVMEGTGPEAAKLAGLEWDRNRWLNDKAYNKALGQAYFLEQYRQFGSLDKAAAAYNAGPGALARAMDRALTLGGSYLDYLPAETQNYVHSTTGMGSAVDIGGGLVRADMTRQRDGLFNRDKPYEDRNAIGKFFYDRDGSLNQNALLSVLMGIGKGAEAQTISPLGGILSGIGAGAEAYKGLQKQAADIGFTKAQTATEAVQLLKNSIYYDANLGMSVIPLAGGGQQSLADFVVNPAGPSMAGPAMDAIIRSIVNGAASRGVDLTTATPEQIFSGAPLPTGQGSEAQPPAAGMPVPPIVTPYESFGTFPMGDAEQAYIAQAETRARMPMTATERQAVIERSENTRAAADAGTASSSLAFRNTNELAATVAKAAANNDLGPLGSVISTYEGLASQLAGAFGIQYDGSAATSQALLNKLSSLSADQMTADTAAASLYLQNKNIFPDITSNATAAAEITAEMLTRNMLAYEKGQYINDLYRAQNGVVKDLTGADALFTREAGNIYQGEKANIAELLKYAGNAEADAEVKQLVVDFFDSANKGAFKDQADAQAALEAIFTILPGQHNVSSGLGRYFVQ